MSLCEHESRLMNYQKEDTEVAKIIYEDIPRFRAAADSQAYIADLKKVMSAMHFENKQL